MKWNRSEVICAFGKWPRTPGDERRRQARAGPGDLAGVTAVRGHVLGERADRAVLAPGRARHTAAVHGHEHRDVVVALRSGCLVHAGLAETAAGCPSAPVLLARCGTLPPFPGTQVQNPVLMGNEGIRGTRVRLGADARASS